MNRRSVLGLGGAVGAAAVVGAGSAPGAGAAATKQSLAEIKATYDRVSAKAGGTWHSYVTGIEDGSPATVIEQDIDYVVQGQSVQKLAVALAVLDKVDRGELSLGQKLDLSAAYLRDGSGLYENQTVIGDNLTLSNLLVTMLQVSDNTAVRMFSRLVPGTEINQILRDKGFVHTQVEPIAGSNAFYLGATTPREMHTLLTGLVSATLLSPSSCQAVLQVMRWSEVGYCDGVRRVMSSDERDRVGIKYGAYEDCRHEVGIIFDASGAPIMTFCYFADNLSDVDNYGSTNPGVQAHAVLGRTMYDVVSGTTDPHAKVRHPARPFRPTSRP
jgi:beta-lactamase class A